MGRDSYSVVRSISRHVARMLGDDYTDVRPADLEGSFVRPFALVELVAGHAITSSAILRDIRLPVTVSAYPRSDDDADEAWRLAMETAEKLELGFTTNLLPPGDVFRIPLYNYTGVPMDATTEERGYCDYLRVFPPVGINPIKDAEDRRLWTVAVDFRCGYRRVGRVPYGGKTTEAVTMQPDLAEGP